MIELPAISVSSEGVHIEGLTSTDVAVADHLRAHGRDEWPRLVNDMLSMGARGLMSMGVGAKLHEIDDRVRTTVSEVLEGATTEIESLLAMARSAISEQLDPEVRSSAMGMTIDRLGELQGSMVRALDVDHASSVTASLLERLAGLLGPDGVMERWVRGQFDQSDPASPLGHLSATIESRFDELREQVIRGQATKERDDLTPRKGFAYEDAIEVRLRAIAAGIGGAVVERTSLAGGLLRSDAKVGDFVLDLEDGTRIVIEAKNTERVTVGGKDGILAKLDKAMANRGADVAICVSATEAFPDEIGTFSVHGRRVLCVDDGSGVLLGVAVRLLRSLVTAEALNPGLDIAGVEDRVQRIRGLATRFSGAKSTLTKIAGSVADVQQVLDDIRTDLLDHTAELGATLARAGHEPEGELTLRTA